MYIGSSVNHPKVRDEVWFKCLLKRVKVLGNISFVLSKKEQIPRFISVIYQTESTCEVLYDHYVKWYSASCLQGKISAGIPHKIYKLHTASFPRQGFGTWTCEYQANDAAIFEYSNTLFINETGKLCNLHTFYSQLILLHYTHAF